MFLDCEAKRICILKIPSETIMCATLEERTIIYLLQRVFELVGKIVIAHIKNKGNGELVRALTIAFILVNGSCTETFVEIEISQEEEVVRGVVRLPFRGHTTPRCLLDNSNT